MVLNRMGFGFQSLGFQAEEKAGMVKITKTCKQPLR